MSNRINRRRRHKRHKANTRLRKFFRLFTVGLLAGASDPAGQWIFNFDHLKPDTEATG
tara:strand:+ start:800 stop:973 length:174 start_codon:yes stop_codon:yes gene_type:complete